MFLFHRKYHWQEHALWSGCVLSIFLFIWSIIFWHWHTSLSVLLSAILFIVMLSCYKIIHLAHLKHQFIIFQDTIATLALIYFNAQFYSLKDNHHPQQTLSADNQKIRKSLTKIHYNLTIPSIMNALHIIQSLNQTKRNIIDDIKNLYSTQDFNLENAQQISEQIYDLINKTQQLFHTVSTKSKSDNTTVKKDRLPSKKRKSKTNKINKL